MYQYFTLPLSSFPTAVQFKVYLSFTFHLFTSSLLFFAQNHHTILSNIANYIKNKKTKKQNSFDNFCTENNWDNTIDLTNCLVCRPLFGEQQISTVKRMSDFSRSLSGNDRSNLLFILTIHDIDLSDHSNKKKRDWPPVVTWPRFRNLWCGINKNPVFINQFFKTMEGCFVDGFPSFLSKLWYFCHHFLFDRSSFS